MTNAEKGEGIRFDRSIFTGDDGVEGEVVGLTDGLNGAPAITGNQSDGSMGGSQVFQ